MTKTEKPMSYTNVKMTITCNQKKDDNFVQK